MGVRDVFCHVQTKGSHGAASLADDVIDKNELSGDWNENDWIQSLYMEAKAKFAEEAKIFEVNEGLTTQAQVLSDYVGDLADRREKYKNNQEDIFEVIKATRNELIEPRIQHCGRGRPRKKSSGKKGGGSIDKQSQDGSENGEGRNGRGRQQRNGGGQGNGGNGGRRRKDEDDRDDDNDEVDDDFDDNNEDDEDDEDEQTGAESAAEESEMTPEQEAAMAQELLCLIPSKDLNCDPPEKPAKPGTAVNLHGVVLHETTGGLVVLNVRWRNKIYSGALIDVKKSKWASERIKPDPFPESANPKTPELLRSSGKRKSKKAKSPELSEKEAKIDCDQKADQTFFKEPSGIPMCFKKPPDTNSNDSTDSCTRKKARMSPPLIECPEPNCGKRYSHKNGLKYHQAHAHQKKDEVDVPTSANNGEKSVKIEANSSVCERECLTDVEDVKPEFSQQNLIELQDKTSNLLDGGKIGQNSNVIGISVPSGNALTAIESDKSSILSDMNVKSEEESALDAIKDVQFSAAERAMKISQIGKDIPEIVLETVAGEDLNDIPSESKLNEIDRPEKLFSVSNTTGLVPFTTRSSSNFSQFSPTLASLNPQMLNNSLSNALQTAVAKTEDKIYRSNEEEQQQLEDIEVQKEVNDKSKLQLNTQTDNENSSNENDDRLKNEYALSRDIKTEDIIPSSPDECPMSNDILPDSLGLHLFQKHANKNNACQSKPVQNELSNFPSSLFSVSLYNQIRQEQAARLFTGADAVTGDLAEPSDIQKAISQVDVRRHVSPMLLNYLNTGSKGKDSNNMESGDLQVVDEVTTSGKNDEPTKAGRKLETKDRLGLSSNATQQITSRSDLSYRKERNNDYRSVPGNMASKAEFLQPNISAGRPISRPVTKPDSITGSIKMGSAMQRQAFHGPSSIHSAGDHRHDELDQSAGFKFTTSSDRISPQSTGKQGNLAQLHSSAIAGDPNSGCEKSEKLKVSSPTSYMDKTLIEAKTWVPQEIYRQPTKPATNQDRSQFSPGKEKQNLPVRMVVDMTRKAGSPYEHGGTSAGVQSTEKADPVSGKKVKAAVPPHYSVTVAANSESVGANIQDQSMNEKDATLESSEISRFSLTSERLVPSPAENRGRPRKIRVEKTQQIPIGSAKDMETSRGAPEHSARKQQVTTCSYTRTSVIHSMSSNMEDARAGVSVKEEYVSPDGKRKMSPNEQERSSTEKKMKPDLKKTEASRIFEAEREKLKSRHVESHYANEVRNMHLRANELPLGQKNEQAIRRSVSPGPSRLSTGPATNSDKSERIARERMESKVVPMSPAFGQSSSYPSHPSSDMEKFRMEYFQHEVSRMPGPFVGSLLPTAEGYPGIPSSFPNSSYFRHRPGLSQAEALAHHRFEQLMSSHMDHDKAFAKYSVEKSDLGLKLGAEHPKALSQERLRPTSGESHSHHPPYYHQASPIAFQNREPSSHPRSPKSSPFSFRTGDMFATSRSQRMDNVSPKDAKLAVGDSRRDVRRDYRPPYGSPFSQPAFQYPNMSTGIPVKSYPQHMNEQRSPYKHSSDADKSRYMTHSSSQPQSGGMLSANLVLTKADGLGFGSVPYEGRNPDSKK